MNILHLSAECYPIAKVGGLADVVGALPKYLTLNGHKAQVIMPRYQLPFFLKHKFREVYSGQIDLGDQLYDFYIQSLSESELGFEVHFVHIPGLLDLDSVYTHDDSHRFTAFQRAALQWICTWSQLPDILHCHDHHTGLVPFMMSYCHEFERLKSIPSMLSIHNAQYQGWFSHDQGHIIPDFDRKYIGLLDWDGVINPLAAAIKCAWKVNTVSPSYMEELQNNANGLESLLFHEREKCLGILNGIDTQVWNPMTDPLIHKNYKATSVFSGKKANKKYVCNKFNLPVELPLFAFIGRLVYEKGSDLFPAVFESLLSRKQCSILLLGSGDPATEQALRQLQEKDLGTYNHYIGYDEQLSHQIYAGADFLLMPSRVEPCGLNQLYSLAYGTIPIVRATGGLKDTVVDIAAGGFGFVHQQCEVDEIVQTVERAIAYYQQDPKMQKNRQRLMGIDHSWENAATNYLNVYESLKALS
ncbi:glycogen synthase [Nonlabens xiamenensis]|uniref:glycogen synthase n=1 Tax=Nonlabens xiamenensis TaxID=2341043 RepID=UPI000F60A126|nr:glycogen/starch synthase [Nonlabens xiamenensis]